MQVVSKTPLSLNAPAPVHRPVRPCARPPAVNRPFPSWLHLSRLTSLRQYPCLLRRHNPYPNHRHNSGISNYPYKLLPHDPLAKLFLPNFRRHNRWVGLAPSAPRAALLTVRLVAHLHVVSFSTLPSGQRQIWKHFWKNSVSRKRNINWTRNYKLNCPWNAG